MGSCSNTGETCKHIGQCSAHESVKTHPDPDLTNIGCANRIEEGVVPNQYGTWQLSRGGWCPGQDVRPWVADITDQVTPGEPVQVYYRGQFKAEDFVPISANNGGFGASIVMESWMVFYH
jgi:hypothetical protein